jgi:hypothetical protein
LSNIVLTAANLFSPTSRHELDSLMEARDSANDERSPPQVYRDDEAASVHSHDSTVSDGILINGSEASDEEYYSTQEPYYASKYIPPRLQRVCKATATWVKGPQPPRPWKIHPIFPKVQIAPVQLLNSYFPKRKHKVILLLFFYFCWLLSFGLVLHRSAFAADIPGYGSPVRVRCNDRFW